MKIFNNLTDPIIVELFNDGKIGIIPTDTVYGFACQANNKDAVNLLYQTKRRGQTKPGTIIAANITQLISLGFIEAEIEKSKNLLNIGVSVIMNIEAEKSYLNFGINSQAARIITEGDLHNLLKKTGPLLTSSANKPGQDPITTIEQGVNLFEKNIAFFVDGGEINNSPSTIVRMNHGRLDIIRNGSIDVSGFLKQNLS